MPAPSLPTSTTIKPEDLSQDAIKDLIMYKARPEMAQNLNSNAFCAHMQGYAECNNLSQNDFDNVLKDVGAHEKYSALRQQILALKEPDIEKRKVEIAQKLKDRGVLVN